jgi:23S rRNA (cytosine1962-C5)-methyltransferase
MNIPVITIKSGFSKPFWAGNPLVYPKAIDHVPSLQAGDWVLIQDAKQIPIAYGFFNPYSLYRIRLIAWVNESNDYADEKAAIKSRVMQAIELRKMLSLPSDETNCYRLINSEGDRLSGLTVDVLGDYLVAHVTALWVQQRQAFITELFASLFPDKTLIWRLNTSALAQDGWKSDDVGATDLAPTAHIIKENGIQYEIDPQVGQKTGFYCDQRETRLLVRKLALDKNVLDVCCFNGGFALNAALGGARSVKGVDTSHTAIIQAQKNAQLNGFKNITFIEQDAIEALHETSPVDLIILDPPKLAPSHKHLANAKRKYLQFNKAALNALTPGGYLLTCSCSQAMSVQDLMDVVLDAALSVQKNIQLLKTGSVGADHPQALAFSHGHYLKWLLIRAFK